MTHHFDVDVATKYGVNAAVILQNIYFWCLKNRANGKNFHDGNYWTYNSRSAFNELFPYLSERQIKTAIDKLVDDGVIQTGCYNDDMRDRTLWYAVTKKGYCILQKCDLQTAEMSNANSENVRPLPYIKPDIKQQINKRERDACAREDNPYGDGDDERPRMDTVEMYAVNNLSTLGYRAMQELADFIDDLSGDIVRHAIDNALDKGVRNWSYVRAILNSYVEHDVQNIADAKAVDEQRKKGGGANGKADDKPDYDEDNRPRAVIPDQQEVECVLDESNPMMIKKYIIRRTGEEIPYSMIRAMSPGERERFWTGKKIRWRNNL